MSTVQLQLGPADRGRRLSFEEFREAEEQEGFRYELAEGVLEVTEVPGPVHRRVMGNLYRVIARYDRDHAGVIETFGGGAEFRLWIPSTTSGRNPDLGVVLEGSPADVQGRTQPALVAEVVSRSSIARDYQTKHWEYLLFGIREYWIVDPLIRQVTVLSSTGERWAEQVARDEESIPSQVLPGLECPTSALWAGVVADDSGE
ncbi:MAG: Uma2 family endonuclease [Isosphaeraceae bacterium]